MSEGGFAFGPYHLDLRSKRLRRDGVPLSLSHRQFAILSALVGKAGEIVAKEELFAIGWPGTFPTDNSLTVAIHQLRATLDARRPYRFIENVARVGYRFAHEVTAGEPRRSEAELRALLDPHEMWVDGSVALESLERDRIASARAAFRQLVATHGEHAAVHVGLAMASILHFEMTRAEPKPDFEAVREAVKEAWKACEIDPSYSEAWATLGFVLHRTPDRAQARAALQRAISLKPRRWQHHLRLADCSWGGARLDAAEAVLALMPECPLARCLAATVYIARSMFADAEREIDAALLELSRQSESGATWSAVALNWLKGLLCMGRGDDDEAIKYFERELALEARGHLYARECCANTWYAIGVVHLRRGQKDAARAAFEHALARVKVHPMAELGLALAAKRGKAHGLVAADAPHSMDFAILTAAMHVAANDHAGAAAVVEAALVQMPPGNAGWTIPIEPLLGVMRAPQAWAGVLAKVRERAK